jgi:formate-dependent nitrite reductase membrane component NrfD
MSEMAIDWINVAYQFIGGLSVGCYIFSVTANYWLKEFKPLAKIGAILAPILVAIGMFLLLIELGQPLRMWRLFLSFNPQSLLSWGSWFLIIFFALSAIYALLLTKDKEEKAKRYAYIGLPFALGVGIYAALNFAFAPGRELWNTALLPWLFLNGALISGIALVMLFSLGKQQTEILSKLGKFVAYLVLLELGMVFTEIIVLLAGGTEAVMSAQLLLVGEYRLLFWLVVILLGLLIPVFILLLKRIATSAYANAIASALLLIGIFTVRYIVIIGEQIIG